MSEQKREGQVVKTKERDLGFVNKRERASLWEQTRKGYVVVNKRVRAR